MNRLALPIAIDDLLHGKSVEWERLEFKAGWNPEDVLHSICAFANDFHNLGGGYILVGVEELDGQPVLPPKGIVASQIDRIQKEILNLGHNAIQPAYHPLTSPVTIGDQVILVIWVPGGETRPYKARASISEKSSDWAYYIRKQSSSVRARNNEEREPIEVRISPDEFVILSFPGPDRSIRMDDLRQGKAISRRYRNRRIGEFFKELDLTEGRSTGIPKIMRAIERNGSPLPVFETDDEYSYFLFRLPVHSDALRGAHDEAHDEAHDLNGTEVAMLQACLTVPQGTPELLSALGYKSRTGNFKKALKRLVDDLGALERTLPDAPRSKHQKYRLTVKGSHLLEKIRKQE